MRVYNGNKFASDDATLASIRVADSKIIRRCEFKVNGNMLVGNFENKMKEEFGIRVQIASPDDTYLVDNKLTLSEAGRL